MEPSSTIQNIQPMSQKEMPVHRPLFDDVSPHNVTAVVGQTAILHCRVKHVSDRTVNTYLKILLFYSEYYTVIIVTVNV